MPNNKSPRTPWRARDIVPDNPLEALEHTLDVFADEPGDGWVLRATSNLLGPGVTTGLTFNDLRELHEELRRLRRP